MFEQDIKYRDKILKEQRTKHDNETEQALARISWISKIQEEIYRFNFIHSDKERYRLVSDDYDDYNSSSSNIDYENR
jgi:hypothetical protein